MLSVLRRIFFCGLFLFLICSIIFGATIPLFALSVIGYVIILLITFLHCKITHERTPFIELIIREDVRDPIVKHSRRHYYKGARIWNIWHFRNYKHRDTKEKVKAWIMRLIVAFVIFLIVCAVVLVIA